MCSRPSCSLCSDSGSEKDESYTEDTESEEAPKKERIHMRRVSKNKYSKNPNSQAPPLPILYSPIHNNGGFMSTSFNEVIDKNESNLMSTSFNVPNCSIPSTSYNSSVPNFIPNPFLSPAQHTKSTAFNSLTNTNSAQSMRSYENLVSPFRNLSMSNQLTPSVAQSSLNSMSLENITSSYHISNFMPSPLTNTSFEPKSVEVPSSLTLSSLDNTNSNVMSTSFSNHLSNTDSTSQNDTYVSGNFDNNDKVAGLTVLKTGKSNTHALLSNTTLNSTQSDSGIITVKPVPTICNDPPPLSLFNSGTNLMSTSFNDPEDLNDDTNSNSCDSSTSTSKQKHSINIPPPPPSITDSLANYIHNLPKKNYVLSRSTPGLADIENLQTLKLQHVKPLSTNPNLLQQQNSVSNILQTHHRNNNFQSTRKYRLDYDLDFIPFHNSCDNLNTLHSNVSHMKSNSYNTPVKSYDSKIFKLSFSQSSTNVSTNREHRLSSNVPPLPVINAPNTNEKSISPSITSSDIGTTITEKPKVKFSDTVTHILVPNTVSNLVLI